MLIRKKSSLWRKIGFGIIGAAILGIIIYLVFYSPIFKINEVNVAIAGFNISRSSELIGDDPRGQNLIFWSIENNRKEDPEIKDLEIHKNYWGRAIQITGSVREKKIVWCFEPSGNEPALRSPALRDEVGCFWVDETGYIFAHAPSIEGSALKVVNDYRSMPLDISDTVLSGAMFNNLNLILDVLVDLNLPIAEIRMEDLRLREFVAYVERGPKITFSLEANPNFIKPALNSLIKSSSWNRTKTVNLTVEGRVYQGF